VCSLAAAAGGHGGRVAVLVIVCSLAGDEFKWKDVVINSFVLTVGSWAIFIVGLKLVIPLWPTFIGNGG